MTTEKELLIVQVSIKHVYGEERIYPKNHQAELFCKLVRQKSLTRGDINLIKELGYTVIVLQEVKEL